MTAVFFSNGKDSWADTLICLKITISLPFSSFRISVCLTIRYMFFLIYCTKNLTVSLSQTSKSNSKTKTNTNKTIIYIRQDRLYHHYFQTEKKQSCAKVSLLSRYDARADLRLSLYLSLFAMQNDTGSNWHNTGIEKGQEKLTHAINNKFNVTKLQKKITYIT